MNNYKTLLDELTDIVFNTMEDTPARQKTIAHLEEVHYALQDTLLEELEELREMRTKELIRSDYFNNEHVEALNRTIARVERDLWG